MDTPQISSVFREGAIPANAFPQLMGLTDAERESVLAAYAALPFSAKVQQASQQMALLPPSNVLLTLGSQQAVKNFERFVSDTQARGQTFDSWESFEKAFFANPDYSKGISKDALYTGFAKDFAALLGIELDDALNMIGGDWSTIRTDPPISLQLGNPNNPLVGFLNKIIKEYKIKRDQLNGSGLGLIDWFQKAIGSGVVLRDQPPYADPTTLSPNPFQHSVSFEEIFKSTLPNGTEEEYQQLLDEFYQEQIEKVGYFIPEQSISEWVDTLTELTVKLEEVMILGDQSGYNMSILNKLMATLIKMIGILQDIAITQGDRVKFKTSMVSGYSELKTQVPAFLKDQKGWWGKSGNKSTDQADMRDKFNAYLTGMWTEKLRAYSGVEEDEAKRLNTSLSATSNTVNAQIDLLTSLIQMMKDLTGAILRR